MYVFMEILSKFCNRLLDITKLIIGIGGMRAEVGIKFGGGDLENFKKINNRVGTIIRYSRVPN